MYPSVLSILIMVPANIINIIELLLKDKKILASATYTFRTHKTIKPARKLPWSSIKTKNIFDATNRQNYHKLLHLKMIK